MMKGQKWRIDLLACNYQFQDCKVIIWFGFFEGLLLIFSLKFNIVYVIDVIMVKDKIIQFIGDVCGINPCY